MRFIIAPSKAAIPDLFPWVKLTRTRDIDHGILSTFRVTVFLAEDEALDLGFVKIIKQKQTKGATPIESSFGALSDDYCSLGQNYRYYEVLFNNLPDYRREFLSALRDAATSPSIRRNFEGEPAYEKSLLRHSPARRAIQDVQRLLGSSDEPILATMPRNVRFSTSVGGGQFELTFKFDSSSSIPKRINVVIGPNGAGKTILLSNLAFVASSKRDQRPSLHSRYGSFVDEEHDFGTVVAISYSAFDRFDLPGKTRREQALLRERGEIEGYVYCGLRRITDPIRKRESLKSIDELESELERNLVRAKSRQKTALLQSVSKILAEDISFDQVGVTDILTHSKRSAADIRRLSSGHKLVINIIVQLVAHLQPHSLVLFDEPESHLHPPLLAKLLQTLQLILREMDSICVIATHSPVVLQEIPSGQVNIIRRANSVTTVSKPRTETFGEDVGSLTTEVFQLNSDLVPFIGIFEQLAAQYSPKEVEELFERKLSFQARSYIQSFSRGST